MALFNRPLSSGSLKSDKSAADSKKNVRFSDQLAETHFEKKESLTGSAQCNNPGAEKKSSVSVENPKSRPLMSLYEGSCYCAIREVCDRETKEIYKLERRLHERLADYTYAELLDLEMKVDPSLGFLQLFVKRAIAAKMSEELKIGLGLL